MASLSALSARLSKQVSRFQSDPFVGMDQQSSPPPPVSQAQAYAKAWESGKISLNDVPANLRPAVKQQIRG